MRILVLGASGMAGHVISTYFRENDFIVDTASARNAFDANTKLVDAKNVDELKKVLTSEDYDAVINCIGLLVKESEADQATAISINAYLPKFLETYYKDSKTKVIHISTNGVFSGNNPPYDETAVYDNNTFYGRTKALGEINNHKDLTIRTSIIGPELTREGKSLFGWFYRQTGEISGFTGSIWAGVTTIELAKAIKAALEQNISGIYHLVPDIKISKYKLLVTLAQVFNKGIDIHQIEGAKNDMSLTNTRTDFHYHIPTYELMIQEMKQWIKRHEGLYEHYKTA